MKKINLLLSSLLIIVFANGQYGTVNSNSNTDYYGNKKTTHTRQASTYYFTISN